VIGRIIKRSWLRDERPPIIIIMIAPAHGGEFINYMRKGR
jgi:hypothetical protein